MTRIGAIQGEPAALRRSARGVGGFALPPGAEAEAAAAASGAAPVSALLALQEAPAAAPRPDEAARRQGEAMLEELRGLQLDLLRGGGDTARLERLARLSAPDGQASDPGLRAAVAEIALRARLELARRRVASASST